ncbi:MAG: GTPase [Planctomycetes bacterium]|nr:GTPase [Planctomycetota bacterium]
MVQINFALKEVNCKIVFYGPGLSGKTTNLEVIHSKAPKSNVGELTSIATEGDRTLFFDFLPLNLGQVAGMTTKFQIYTVPGQVYYNSTRKLVLQGADGIVFVADSRRGKIEENLESFKNLEDNMKEYGMDLHTIPLVFQYNKRDLQDIYTIEELEKALNHFGAPYFEAVAVNGDGVFPTLKKVSSMVLENLNKQQSPTKVKAKKPQAAKEPELVPAGNVSKEEAAAAASGPVRGPAPRGAPVRPQAAAPVRHQSPGAVVVKEKVTSAPGVKPIERKVPAGGSVVKRRPMAEPVAAPAISAAAKGGSGGGKPIFWIVILVVLAGAAAAIFFSGIWEKFI